MKRIFRILAFALTVAVGPQTHAAEEIVLETKAAKLEGGGRYDDSAAYKCIRDWKNTNMVATWTFEAPSKGAYRIFVTYACPANIAGSAIEVSVSNQRANAFTQSSGGWEKFKEFDLGPILLRKSGTYELSVKATTNPFGTVFDLRKVRLVPDP